MDKTTLTNYLEKVVELEKQVYLQDITISRLKEKINSLGRRSSFREPKEEKYSDGLVFSFVFAFAFGFLSFLLSAASCTSCISLDIIADRSTMITLLGSTLLNVLIGGAIGFLIGLIVDLSSRKKANREYKAKYESEVNALNEAKYNDAVRVNNELQQKAVLQQNLKILQAQKAKTEETRARFYSANIIYGKYRNFSAVSSFLDYFKSGRCSTLGENRGGDGAYNTYENELRQDIIISKLNDIIVRLDEIKANQWTIYNAIQDVNRISNNLITSTERLALSAQQSAQSSAIAAYSAQEAAWELNQIKWLQLYRMI